LLAPKVILEQIGFWVWPFGQEPLAFSIAPTAVMRLGLFYWLILIVMIRLAWRLRQIEPWLFRGFALAVVALIPFSGVFPSWVQPFDSTPLAFAGIGLSVIASAVILRGLPGWPVPAKRAPRNRETHWGRLLGATTVIWLLAHTINLVQIAGREWETRLDSLIDNGNRDLVVAVEQARHLARSNDFPKAESLILRAEQAAPWYAEIPVVKAEILLARGEPAAADVFLIQALAQNPQHERAQALRNATASGLQPKQ